MPKKELSIVETVMSGKFPMMTGDAVDLLYEVRQNRLALSKQLDALKEAEGSLATHCTDLLKAAGLESARGKIGTLTRTTKDTPSVIDWDKFCEWAIKNGTKIGRKTVPYITLLVQKRLATTSAKELKEAGIAIDGVEWMQIPDYSLTKATAPK